MKEWSDEKLLKVIEGYDYVSEYSSKEAIEFDLVCSELCSRGYIPVRVIKFKKGGIDGKAKG